MGAGPATARLFIVGEQPGDREDVTGQPFVGPSGQLLRVALQEIGIDIGGVFVTNAVKHFSYEMRGKRRMHKTPAQADVARCAQWLEAELQAVGPSTIVALGRTALNAIGQLSEFEPAAAPPPGSDLPPPSAQRLLERGRWRGALVVAVAHPSALLRAGASPGSEGYLRWREALREATRGAHDPAESGVASEEPSAAHRVENASPDGGLHATSMADVLPPRHSVRAV
jgi:DNA polymerase